LKQKGDNAIRACGGQVVEVPESLIMRIIGFKTGQESSQFGVGGKYVRASTGRVRTVLRLSGQMLKKY
jgi:hypothetical protein